MSTEKITLTVSGILADLQNGYSRTTSDKSYQGEGKSIEEKYGLNKTQVKELFLHEKLKNKKTILPKESVFTLIDDTNDNTSLPLTAEESVQASTSIKNLAEEENSQEVLDSVEEKTKSDNWDSLH